MNTTEKTARIAALNNQLRQHGIGGRILITAGIEANETEFLNRALALVRTFDEFTEDNDPHGENDFGAVEVEGEKVFWKIDYYDLTLTYASEDPSNPDVTVRVLTIMLASEY